MENVDNLIIGTPVITGIDFYKNVFNWKIVTKPTVPEPYWMVMKNATGDTPIEAVFIEKNVDTRGSINTFITKDIAAITDRIGIFEGKILSDITDVTVDGNTWKICFCKDIDGNIFSVLQKKI